MRARSRSLSSELCFKRPVTDPTPLPVQVADICGGAMPAVIQILGGCPHFMAALRSHCVTRSVAAALRRKEKEGKGSIIGVSVLVLAMHCCVLLTLCGGSGSRAVQTCR